MATTIILGDIAEGQKWWGTAEFLKTQLAATYRQNNSFMHTWKQVSADTKIFCEMRAGTPWAFIFSGSELYMESGFYDLLSAATCNENTYKPAIFHYNSPIQTYISSLNKPLQGKLNLSELAGEQLLDGMQSISVGGSALITSASDPCGNTYISETGVFATNSEKIRLQKMAQNRVPSSLYSGKMRLFIQAVYGSRRSDYYINLGIDNLPVAGDYTLYMYDTQGDSFELGWGYPYTCGIYTTDDHQFYLMKVVTSEIRFYPLVPTPVGSSLRTKLIEAEDGLSAQDIEKLEAYILSTCQIDTANSFIVSIPGAPSIGGIPLGYGWKFSKSGHKCTIVIHADDEVLKLVTAHQITVQVENVGQEFSASVVEYLTGTWRHGLFFAVWRPDFYLYSQLQVGSYSYGTELQTSSCPIYGYYEDEQYKSITLDASVYLRSETTAAESPDRQVQVGCGATDLSPYSWGTYNGAYGDVIVSGLFDEVVSNNTSTSEQTKTFYWTYGGTPQIMQGTYYNPEASWIVCDKGVSAVTYLVSIGAWKPNGPYYEIDWDYTPGEPYAYGKSMAYTRKQLRHNLATRGNVSNRGKIAVVVPLGDCESAVLVKQQVNESGSSNQFYGGIDGNCISPSALQEVDVRLEISTGNIIATSYGATYEAGESPEFSTSSGGIIGTAPALEEATASMAISEKTSGTYKSTEDGYTVEETSGVTADVAWSEAYIHGTLNSPLSKSVVTKASYNGAMITYHYEGSGENVNGFRHDSAVGWA